MIYCMKCSEPLDPFYNFCPYCGSEAPRSTIIPDAQPIEIKEGHYCVHCGKLNVMDALFCSDCGKSLYERPEKASLFCPKCSKHNKLDAHFCYNCALNFDDWFAMRGSIVENLAYRDSFVMHETLNDLYYHFIRKEKVTIGRNESHDIVMPSGWVSGNHCLIDLKRWQLRDENSTNGTFTNRKSDRLSKQSLDLVQEFNIAGVFTFSAIKKQKLFIIRLTAILDKEGLKREGRLDDFDALRKHFFILIGGDGVINIRKMDGEILSSGEDWMEYFTIAVRNDGYYFTDADRDIKDKLLLRKYNNLPVNLEFEFGN